MELKPFTNCAIRAKQAHIQRCISIDLSCLMSMYGLFELFIGGLCLSTWGRKCQVSAYGGCERDIVHRMNEQYRAWGALKSVLSNRGFGIKAKNCLSEGVIVPTTLYGTEAWGMRSAERRKVNVLKMKCLRNLVGMSRMDRVRNEEVRTRAGILRELASRADQRVLRWFGHVKEWMSTVWPEWLMAEVSGGRVRRRPR